MVEHQRMHHEQMMLLDRSKHANYEMNALEGIESDLVATTAREVQVCLCLFASLSLLLSLSLSVCLSLSVSVFLCLSLSFSPIFDVLSVFLSLSL